MLQLIASDIDGTLMRGGERCIPSDLFPLIRQLREKGILFAACSGRQYSNIRNLFAPVADEIAYICENGSLVVWQDEILVCDTIDRTRGQALMRAIREQPDGSEVLLSGIYTSYVQPKDPAFVTHLREHVGNVTTVVEDICAVEDDYIKISIYRKSGVDEELAQKFSDFAPYLTPVVGRSTWMDFLRENSDKGTALDALCAHFGIANTDSIAYCDNENDLPLVGHAGTVCAMADGHPALIAKADYTTFDVVQDIKRFL